MASPDATTAPGAERRVSLRERKKARTREAIQSHALRLFREQGYAATTIDEIAEAADVSQSTFFRYFRTKEEVAIYDALDPLLIEIYRAQPPELKPLAALRTSLRLAREQIPQEMWEVEMARHALIVAEPALQSAMFAASARVFGMIAMLIAERAGRPADDFAVRTLAGAIIGVTLATMIESPGDRDYFVQIEQALELLDDGLRF